MTFTGNFPFARPMGGSAASAEGASPFLHFRTTSPVHDLIALDTPLLVPLVPFTSRIRSPDVSAPAGFFWLYESMRPPSPTLMTTTLPALSLSPILSGVVPSFVTVTVNTSLLAGVGAGGVGAGGVGAGVVVSGFVTGGAASAGGVGAFRSMS